MPAMLMIIRLRYMIQIYIQFKKSYKLYKYLVCSQGEVISLTPFYIFHRFTVQHLDISRPITADSTPLHIAGDRIRFRKPWFPSASR